MAACEAIGGTSKDQPKEQANRGWKTELWTLEIAGILVAAPPRSLNLSSPTRACQ